MATIRQFQENPKRIFSLRISVENQPPETVSIVYELAPGPVTFAAAPLPAGFSRSGDGRQLTGSGTVLGAQATFAHPFGLDNAAGQSLISVKALVTWPAGSFDALFAQVLP